MVPTCEILSKVLLQLNCLVKDFIGLLVCLPLVHFPERHIFIVSITDQITTTDDAVLFTVMCTSSNLHQRFNRFWFNKDGNRMKLCLLQSFYGITRNIQNAVFSLRHSGVKFVNNTCYFQIFLVVT